jgi:hypothetical protein
LLSHDVLWNYDSDLGDLGGDTNLYMPSPSPSHAPTAVPIVAFSTFIVVPTAAPVVTPSSPSIIVPSAVPIVAPIIAPTTTPITTHHAAAASLLQQKDITPDFLLSNSNQEYSEKRIHFDAVNLDLISSSLHELLLKQKNKEISVSQHDITTLTSGVEINDGIINCVLGILVQQHGLQFQNLPSYMSSSLQTFAKHTRRKGFVWCPLKLPKPIEYARQRIDLYAHQLSFRPEYNLTLWDIPGGIIFLPYHIPGHWMLVTVDLTTAHVSIYDSLASKVNFNNCCKVLDEWLAHLTPLVFRDKIKNGILCCSVTVRNLISIISQGLSITLSRKRQSTKPAGLIAEPLLYITHCASCRVGHQHRS